MDFNFPEKKGTGIDRLIPHASPELVELLKKLIKYDPDERILARTALKDHYFRDLREAQKAQQSGSAGNATAGSEKPAPGQQLSASSSSCSVGNADNPEVTGGKPASNVAEASAASHGPALTNHGMDNPKS